MFSILLAIIYLAFISLGLPDALLGSVWPMMHPQMHVPISWSGIVFMIISFGTMISAMNSDRLNRRFGTGVVTACSTAMTAMALFGFSCTHSFPILCLWAIPYGLGAGSIDAALNNYVALHYASRHMSWLHCMWGIGASIGPYIMSFALQMHHSDWHAGYRYVGALQTCLTLILLASLPLWKRNSPGAQEDTGRPLSLREVLAIPGTKEMLAAFFFYCAVEQTAGLWASSWMVEVRQIDAVTAARFAGLFYLGITLGRFFGGFITMKLNDRQMIRLGQGLILAAVLCLLQPFSQNLALFGLVLTGCGCAPVFPTMIHSIPGLFGTDRSQAIVGIMMAGAYAGISSMPPLFGLLAGTFGLNLFPFYLLAAAAIMVILTEKTYRKAE
ncbi:MAG: MFS transporter [Solobacterium sp.]|nr:MFS transporter [Solobacterium sp.]